MDPFVLSSLTDCKMSDHSDLKHFLKSLDKMLDTVASIIYTAKCKIRVEQRLNDHAESFQEKVSASTESKALLPTAGQGGPEPHVKGTSTERSRSQKAAEKVQLTGGRMETPHGK